MPDPEHPNVFDYSETPILRAAFELAWVSLSAKQAGALENSEELQRRVANAIIAAAATGILDARNLADAAVKSCAPDEF